MLEGEPLLSLARSKVGIMMRLSTPGAERLRSHSVSSLEPGGNEGVEARLAIHALLRRLLGLRLVPGRTPRLLRSVTVRRHESLEVAWDVQALPAVRWMLL